MASLWRPLRLLPRLQSTFSQPLGLRICTPLPQRLLHSSPQLDARKPSGAVVKPVITSKQKPVTTSKQKPVTTFRQKPVTTFKQKPKQQHPTTITQSTPITRPTPTTQQQPAPTRIRPQPYVEKPQPLPERPTTAHASAKLAFDYVAGGHSGIQASLRALDSADSPTLIYEATKPRAYVAWCLLSSVVLGSVAAVHVYFANDEKLEVGIYITSMLLITAAFWAGLSIWAAVGATDVIRRIWAIPTGTGRPLLRIEPVRIFAGKHPLPFHVRLGEAFSNLRFKEPIAMFEATRPVRRKPGVLDGFFGPIGTIWSSNIKMCTRKASFAKLRIADEKNQAWRVDLRDCKVHDHGKSMSLLATASSECFLLIYCCLALDLLILPGVERPGRFLSLFQRE
jgi:hypothetical protein